MLRRPLPGLALVALAAMTWGTTGTTLKLTGLKGPDVPLVVAAARLVVAAPLLWVAARGIRTLPPLWTLLVTGACMAAYQVSFFSGVRLAGVAVTALMAICSAPLLIAVLARLVLHESLSRRAMVALAVGVVGAGLLVGSAAGGSLRVSAGIGLAALAGLGYAVYAVVTKIGMRSGDPTSTAAATFSVAALLLLPLLFVFAATTAAVATDRWPYVLYLGIVPTALAYWLYNRALKSASPTTASVVGLLEPLTASLLGVVVFHEHLGLLGWLGGGLLLGAVGLITTADGTRAAAPVPLAQ